jgi:hypothetical protein
MIELICGIVGAITLSILVYWLAYYQGYKVGKSSDEAYCLHLETRHIEAIKELVKELETITSTKPTV